MAAALPLKTPCAPAGREWIRRATVADIRSELATADAALAGRVIAYERRHKGRKGVFEAAEARRGA